jgi:hypothetical protein
MNSHLYGFAPNSWLPGPDFRARNDERGLTTATQTFRCAKGDFGNPIVQLAFSKGSPIAGVYPQVEEFYRFLQIDSTEATDVPGGITEISVSFVGRTPTTQEFGVEDEREITFTRNNGLEKKPIIENPKFINEVILTERFAIIQAVEGKAFQSWLQLKNNPSAENIIVWDALDNEIATIQSEQGRFWWNAIIKQGWREYETITSEWTKTGTNVGLLKSSDIDKMGQIDQPEKDPYTPKGFIWRMTGSTESTSSIDANSYSITWTMIEDTVKARKLFSNELDSEETT